MKYFYLFLLLSVILIGCNAANNTPLAPHVIIIGVDGLSPDGIRSSNTPNLDDLMANGAHTMHARAVMPTNSGPNWGSMLMGAGPEQHGILSNDWRPDNVELPPTVTRNDNHFPSIFAVIRDQRPDAITAAFLDWNPIEHFIEDGVVSHLSLPANEMETTNDVVTYMAHHQPMFTFIHLDHVDGAGHRYGHGSDEYYRAVERADSLIGVIVESTRKNGMFDRTVFIISSDHGGIGYGHGGNSLSEMEIPFIVSGARTKSDHELRMPVNVYDVPATALFALGITQPYEWTARPARNAFTGFEDPILFYHFNQLLPPPVITPAGEGGFNPPGGLFIDGTRPTVRIDHHEGRGAIRITLDGTLPDATSPVYTEPFTLEASTVVKARVFVQDRPASDVTTAYFRIINDTTGRGLRYSTYTIDAMSRLPDFSLYNPVHVGTTLEISSNTLTLPRRNHVAAVLEGYIDIPRDGYYTFSLSSDDGSKLYINRRLVIDNDGDHGVITVSNSLLLGKGRHPIRVEWFNGGGGYWLAAFIESVDIPRQIIPADMLYRSYR